MPGDENDVGVGLGHSGSDGADSGFGDQLDTDPGPRIDLLEVVDQLGQIFNRVNVVVRGRTDQGDAGLGVAQLGDDAVDLVAGKLAALSGLGTLGHLDFEFLGAGEVLRGDAETAGSDLLDLGVGPVTVRIRLEAARIFAALTGIGFSADAIHGDSQGLVCLGADRAHRHGRGGEAAADVFDRLDFIDGNGAAFPGNQFE